MLSSLDKSIDELGMEYGIGYFTDFEDHFLLLGKALNVPNFPRHAAKAFFKFNKEILKEELVFRETGRYSSSEFSQVQRDVYENPEVMVNYYLTGLYLTYFIWPHHYKILQFFRNSFLNNQKNVTTFMEWGVGHGLLSKMLFDRCPMATARLYDLSPYSLVSSRHLLEAAGFHAFESILGNIVEIRTEQADAIICGELLEHVPDPEKLLCRLRESLCQGGRAFMTGAINSAQEDHLTLFTSVEEIVQLVTAADFRIIDSVVLAHPNREHEIDAPTVLAMVLE